MSLNESLHRSYSKQDPLMRYNPSKPAKYGQQCQVLLGPDGSILLAIPDLDPPINLYFGLGELLAQIIPKQII